MTDREKFEAWAIKDYSWAEDMLSKAEFCHSDNDEWYAGIGIDPLFWLWRGWQAATEAAKPQWIAIDDRMPADESVVLVSDERGIIWCAEVQDGKIYPDEFLGITGGCHEPTHWMPLPEPPTK